MVVCADAMFLCLDIFPKERKEAWERKPVPPVLCHVSRAVKQRPKLALADTELGCCFARAVRDAENSKFFSCSAQRRVLRSLAPMGSRNLHSLARAGSSS